MEHSKPLLNPLPLLPPISHKFLVFTCWVKCLTTQVFPRLADLEVTPGVCSILISMPLFTCIPFVFWNQGTQQGLFLREDKVLTWVGAQDAGSRDWDFLGWICPGCPGLRLSLYLIFSPPTCVYTTKSKQFLLTSLGAVSKLQSPLLFIICNPSPVFLWSLPCALKEYNSIYETRFQNLQMQRI